MSFAFMPFYTGDYLKDTRHLSMMEHGAFVMFLTYSWDQRSPIPLDERKQIGIVNARSKEEIEAMRAVLREFFVLMDDGWYNRRMQREIERADAISDKRKAAGRKGFQAKAKHLSSKSRAGASTLTITTNTTSTTNPKSIAPSELALLPWLPLQEWEDYKRHRREMRHPLTPTAERQRLADLQRWHTEGKDIPAILKYSIANGYQGLFPEGERSRTTRSEAQAWLEKK